MCATGQVLALLGKEDTNPNRTCNPNPNPKPGRNGKGTRLCRLGWLVGGKPRRSRRIESSGGSFGCPGSEGRSPATEFGSWLRANSPRVSTTWEVRPGAEQCGGMRAQATTDQVDQPKDPQVEYIPSGVCFCVVSCFVFVVCTRMTATALSKRTIRPSVYWQVDDDSSSPGYRMNYLGGSDAAFQTAATMLRCRSGHHRASAIVHRALIR